MICRYTGQRGEYRVYCRTASGPGADPPLGILFVHSGGTKCDHPGRYRCWKDIPGLFPGCGGQPELLRRSVSPAAGSSGGDRCGPEGWDLSGIYLHRISVFTQNLGQTRVGCAKGLSAPGVIFSYGEYVRFQRANKATYLEFFKQNSRSHIIVDGRAYTIDQFLKLY